MTSILVIYLPWWEMGVLRKHLSPLPLPWPISQCPECLELHLSYLVPLTGYLLKQEERNGHSLSQIPRQMKLNWNLPRQRLDKLPITRQNYANSDWTVLPQSESPVQGSLPSPTPSWGFFFSVYLTLCVISTRWSLNIWVFCTLLLNHKDMIWHTLITPTGLQIATMEGKQCGGHCTKHLNTSWLSATDAIIPFHLQTGKPYWQL